MSVLAIDYQSGIEDAWSDVATFVPKLVAFLVVLVIGYIVARIIARVARKLMARAGLDRAVEKGGLKSYFDRSGSDAGTILGKVIFYALMLVVLQLAFGVFGQNAVSDMLDGVVAYIPRAFAAVLIIVIAGVVAMAVRDLIGASMGGLSYGKTLASGAAIAIVTVGVFAALNQLQIAPAIVNGLFYALLAVVAGSAIVAIGGGGIGPMQQRWRQVLQRYDEEKPRLRSEMEHARHGDGHGDGDRGRSNGGATHVRSGL